MINFVEAHLHAMLGSLNTVTVVSRLDEISYESFQRNTPWPHESMYRVEFLILKGGLLSRPLKVREHQC